MRESETENTAAAVGAVPEDAFRLMVESVVDYAIFMLDPNGYIQTWNPGAQRINGYSPNEIIGRHFSVFYPPEDVKAGKPQWELEVAAREGRVEDEGWRVRKDGSRFWSLVVITALHDASGRLRGFGKVTRDLTERKQAELDAIRLKEEQFSRAAAEEARRIAENAFQRADQLQKLTAALSGALTSSEVAAAIMKHGVGTLGAFGCLLFIVSETGEVELVGRSGYANGATARVLKFPITSSRPLTEAIRSGNPVFLGDPEAIAREIPNPLDPMAVSQSKALAVLPMSSTGGSAGAMVLSFAEPRILQNQDRDFMMALAHHCGQSLDRARLHEAQTRTNQNLRFLADASALFSSTLDPQTVLTNLAQRAVPRIADWCAVEMVEGPGTRQLVVAHIDPAKVKYAWELRERYPPKPTDPAGVLQVIRTGKPELYPEITDEMLDQITPDVEQRRIVRELGLISAMTVPLKARSGTIGALSLVTAESGRHYTPADLAFAEELAARAALAVENANLYAQAQAAVRIRDEFLSVAGHELKTPLAALQLQVEGVTRLAERGGVAQDPGRVVERIQKMSGHTHRLGRLINELLDVTRITAGRLELSRERFDLSDLVREVIERLAEASAQSHAPVALHAEPAIGEWDRVRIDQVVSNLIGNAIKYGAGKPVDVSVTAKNGAVQLRVQDRGIGIDPAHRERIFGRFERAVSDRHYGGLGLGLWIVRQIVVAHGGEVEVESELGKGATFTVELPRRPGEGERKQ